MVFLFVYGTQFHYIRIGFIGKKPLVYGVYAIDNPDELPTIPAMTYRQISLEQYEWLRNHLKCDVVLAPGGFGVAGNLECKTHGAHKLFTNEFISIDLWEERQV